MNRLYDQFRPTTLADVVGQPKAVATAERLAKAGIGGQALWISGPSGAGKTTIARILAGTLADGIAVTEYDSADELTASELRAISDAMGLFGLGRGGRVWIVNEAHGLRKPIIRGLLGLLERLPAHCAIIFTTTRDGQDALFEDEIDAGPLLSRCVPIRLTNQGFAKPAAARCREIAQAVGLDGQPVEAYVKLLYAHKGNMRAALTAIQAGAMLPE